MCARKATPTPPAPVETLQPPPPGPQSLVDEILEATALAETSVIFADNAVARAIAASEALDKLRNAAIKSTDAPTWTLFKDEQGRVFGTPAYAAAIRIATYFGIKTYPDGPAKIRTVDGTTNQFAEVTGRAMCMVTGAAIAGIRGKRFAHEEFTGRRQRTKTNSGTGEVYQTGVDVGLEDLKDAARTSFERKAICVLSGIIKMSVEELAGVWGVDVATVMRRGAMGHGFTKEERANAAKANPAAAVNKGGGGQQGRQFSNPNAPADKAPTPGKITTNQLEQLTRDATGRLLGLNKAAGRDIEIEVSEGLFVPLTPAGIISIVAREMCNCDVEDIPTTMVGRMRDAVGMFNPPRSNGKPKTTAPTDNTPAGNEGTLAL